MTGRIFMKIKTIAMRITTVAVATVSMLIMSACASEPITDWSKVTPNQDFVEVYSDFFENQNRYWVINKDGADVTTEFWKTYYADYSEGIFNRIFAYVMDNDCTLEWDSSDQEIMNVSSRATFLTYTISHTFYKQIDISELYGGTTAGVKYTVRGSYTVNDGYDKIISKTDAELDIDQFISGSNYPCYLESSSTSQSISSDSKTVDFSASFKVRVVYEINGTYIPLDKIVCGPIQGHIRGNTSGKVTKYW